jgi:hypothetical protein
MTPLEDRVRQALAGKAREFPPDAVPPLRLPASRGWLAPAAAAVMVAAVIAGFVAVSHVLHQPRGAVNSLDTDTDADAARSNAASWVAAQVSRSTMVSCDPVMCGAIESRGFPAAYLDRVLTGLRPSPTSHASLGPRFGAS